MFHALLVITLMSEQHFVPKPHVKAIFVSQVVITVIQNISSRWTFIFFSLKKKHYNVFSCTCIFGLIFFSSPPGTDTFETSASTYNISSFCLSTPYGYQQLDLDFVKYVGDIKQKDTIRRFGFNRRPRASPVSETQSRVDPSHWASSESLSSVSSDEARNPSITAPSSSSSVNRRRPPLPPSYSSLKSTPEIPEHSQTLPHCHKPSEGKPPPATCQLTASKLNSLVDKTLVETCRRLEQEKASSQTIPLELHPRHRLASFGGLSSSGTLSPYTSWNALNPTQTQAASKRSVPEKVSQSASTVSSTLRISPSSSGRATPVASVSPLHLQQVRDQMMVALERLKELEEQVKTIPVLQVKISVLQEEKRQLIAFMKHKESQSLGSNVDKDLQGLFRKRAHSTGSAFQLQQQSSKKGEDDMGKKTSSEELESQEHSALSGLKEFKQLHAEMQLLEKKILDARFETQQMSNSKTLGQNSVTLGDDKNISKECKHSVSCCKDIAVETRLETRSTGVGVTEDMLGVVLDTELELELQQHTIQVLSETVQTLEADLKEALLKAEMCKLKSELWEAGSRNRADKSSSAQPEMQSTAVQTKAQTRTLGVGNHTQLLHVAVGEGVVHPSTAVGMTCRTETRGVASGPDIPIDMWEVRKRIERKDQCVGKEHVPTCSKGVGTAVSVHDIGIVTLELMETMGKKKVPSRTIGCGDCTIDIVSDINVSVVKPLVSKGTVTDPVRGIDLGIIVTPQTLSQCTSTAGNTVSRCTSTSQVYVSESSTNTTSMLTRERHTNTAHVITRTLAIGDGKVSDQRTAVKVRSVAVGTTGYMKESAVTAGIPKVMTRNIGVGLANVNENYLVGLRTRNIACGPSCLPDPVKTRSIGIEFEPGLDHYIDRMQRLLKEQQSLLTDRQCEQREGVTLQPQDHIDVQHGVPGKSSPSNTKDHSEYKTNNPMVQSNGPPGDDGSLRSIMKRKDISQGAESRKTLKPGSPGFERMSISEDSFSEGFDFEDEEKRKGKRKEEQEEIGSTKASKMARRERYMMSEKVLSFCHNLKTHLNDSKALSSRELRSSLNPIQQEWFRVSSQKKSCPDTVEDFLCACRRVSLAVLTHVANMADQNGNTALHYSVSHSNFRVVQKLLDAGVCNIDQQNKAGYTPIMLAALAAVETQEDMKVVEGLFGKGDVNAKAIQAGQTALMLAVSHGRLDMVKVLLTSGSKVNVQDDEGSTALMCASEHGHTDIVKLLLAHPGCDATLSDNDDSTALSVALEAGHKDIAMLLYAHVNYAKGQSVGTSRSRTPPAPAARGLFE
ncbi:KN motif and ankyrin repeat domain-containing protein 1b isoform X2 [Pygocentrus nattereri]|uniref:KN motif and ankyrin repeat domain-containing protein 1b isoform X2 n=1 Tax=Pygocentrus nattereri TaxID=42514 RepID=UPI0018917176|nr:KN motif and ankyrin repeat domain-containing protein 1b isoform X2 [Pygocentrus nattereri]